MLLKSSRAKNSLPLPRLPDMRFLIDENIRWEIEEFLQAENHDVMRVPQGLENGKVVQLAKEEKRILLTHDKHFAHILLYPPKNFSGIIRIKIHPPSASTIINALKNLLRRVSSEEIAGRLIILEKDDFRIR